MIYMKFSEQLQQYQLDIEQVLDKWLPKKDQPPQTLHQAMRYSVLANGKRIRPIFLYATGEFFNVPLTHLHGPSCAVELIHSYSLIHDDLPAMDDDDLRRGRPTCHKHYDEATAILAGDALQTLAFRILAIDKKMNIDDAQRLKMIDTLAKAAGSEGMAGGQIIDLEATGKDLSLTELKYMHHHKTGKLIQASCQLGALANPHIDPEALEQISHYAKYIGLAFQIKDDILDVNSNTEILGKPKGSDIKQNKPTYTKLLGIDGAKQAAQKMYEEAISYLQGFGKQANMLRDLSTYIIEREK